MATWEDGPEYAPLERPDGFHLADVAPLEIVPAQGSLLTQAPDVAPRFQPSATPGPPLDTLAPQREQPRDPSQPFAVVESSVTADTSAWSSAHSSSLIQQPGGWGPPSGPAVAGPAGPPPAALLRDATAPFQLTHQQGQLTQPGPVAQSGPPYPPPSAGFPQPGTTQWFGPPPAGMAPVAATPQLTLPQALTWGYIVVLAMSLLWVIAPATLIIGAILAGQVKLGQPLISRIRTCAMIGFGVIALLAIPLGPGTIEGWWATISTWALLIALSLLLVSVIVVMRARSDTGGGYPPPGSNWG